MLTENMTKVIIKAIAHNHSNQPEKVLECLNELLLENIKDDRAAIASRLGALLAITGKMRPNDGNLNFDPMNYATGRYLIEQGWSPETVTAPLMKSLEHKMPLHKNIIEAHRLYATEELAGNAIDGPPPLIKIKGSHVHLFSTDKLLEWEKKEKKKGEVLPPPEQAEQVEGVEKPEVLDSNNKLYPSNLKQKA